MFWCSSIHLFSTSYFGLGHSSGRLSKALQTSLSPVTFCSFYWWDPEVFPAWIILPALCPGSSPSPQQPFWPPDTHLFLQKVAPVDSLVAAMKPATSWPQPSSSFHNRGFEKDPLPFHIPDLLKDAHGILLVGVEDLITSYFAVCLFSICIKKINSL